ncbi:MAG: prepilin-type N-terminal cleavage/methylation domain-containing protein [Thermodesulfovibrionia bacterium]|nr:prepilin-type N-terminal cleavage/methylation domain-containing protein [Thermodesulfovibrionia bacterium]
MNNFRHTDKKGFTIIELLVSLAILVIVLGAVYATFFSIQRALDRFNNISMKYHEARTALDIMRREIESSYFEPSAPGNEGKTETRPQFSFKDKDIFGKNASDLNLTSFSLTGTALNISYHVEEEAGSLKLMKQESPAFQPTKGYTLEMMNRIESLTVEASFEKKWVKVWDAEETGKLPDMLRVTIAFDDNGKIVSLREYARPVIKMKL